MSLKWLPSCALAPQPKLPDDSRFMPPLNDVRSRLRDKCDVSYGAASCLAICEGTSLFALQQGAATPPKIIKSQLVCRLRENVPQTCITSARQGGPT